MHSVCKGFRKSSGTCHQNSSGCSSGVFGKALWDEKLLMLLHWYLMVAVFMVQPNKFYTCTQMHIHSVFFFFFYTEMGYIVIYYISIVTFVLISVSSQLINNIIFSYVMLRCFSRNREKNTKHQYIYISNFILKLIFTNYKM